MAKQKTGRGNAFSQREKNALAVFVHSNEVMNKDVLQEFCTKFNRRPAGAMSYVYRQRRTIKTQKLLNVSKLKKDETVVLPLKNFQVEVKDGKAYVRFSF
jgi:hypothetical protein